MADSAPGLTTADTAIEAIVATLNEVGIGRPPIVLIDGRSGAGKTTLAEQAAQRVPAACVIRLDDIYPGWHGLERAHRHVLDNVLIARAHERSARWQRWNWSADAPAEWVEVDPSVPLIIEGVGVISAEARSLAQLALWVELDVDARKVRALSRDGDTFTPHWDQWARDEDGFIAREHPRNHADLIVDGRSIRSE